MCGRYVSARDKAALLEQFHASAASDEVLPADYNVAPSKKVYAVLDRADDDAVVARELRVLRWGLVSCSGAFHQVSSYACTSLCA